MIKKVLLSMALLAPLTLSAATLSKQDFDNCVAVGEFSGTIMTHRQNGVPLSQLLVGRVIRSSEVLKQYTIQTYSHPIETTERQRNAVIKDYQQQSEYSCIVDLLSGETNED